MMPVRAFKAQFWKSSHAPVTLRVNITISLATSIYMYTPQIIRPRDHVYTW